MGIGNERKREKQEEIEENKRLKEAANANPLIDRVPPDKEPLISARSTHQLPPEENLTVMSRVSPDGKWVEFLHGETVCGKVETDIAKDLGAPLEATYFEVVSDKDDVLKLRPRPMDRRRLRPPVDDEDDDD